MALLRPSEPAFRTAEAAAQRRGFAAESELALRHALEAFCRGRWPDARLCHEMVMGARQVRADVVAIDLAHIAAFEIKGDYDDTVRLLHQVGMYQLCVPEVWMVAGECHTGDAEMIRHLLPSVGLITGTGWVSNHFYVKPAGPVAIEVRAEAVPRPVCPEMMLEMMWADELRAMCGRLHIAVSPRVTRGHAIRELLAKASLAELQRECCTELRGRDALWRADPPVTRQGEGLA
jgi:hypothetical protein